MGEEEDVLDAVRFDEEVRRAREDVDFGEIGGPAGEQSGAARQRHGVDALVPQLIAVVFNCVCEATV